MIVTEIVLCVYVTEAPINYFVATITNDLFVEES